MQIQLGCVINLPKEENQYIAVLKDQIQGLGTYLCWRIASNLKNNYSQSHLETNSLACVRALTLVCAKQKKCIFLHFFVQNLSTLVPLYYCAFPLLLQLLCIFTRLLQLSIFFFFLIQFFYVLSHSILSIPLLFFSSIFS